MSTTEQWYENFRFPAYHDINCYKHQGCEVHCLTKHQTGCAQVSETEHRHNRTVFPLPFLVFPISVLALSSTWYLVKPNVQELALFLTSQVLIVKNSPAKAGDVRDASLTPGSERSPGGGHGNPLQYPCLENLMDRGAWRATVHRVTKSQYLRSVFSLFSLTFQSRSAGYLLGVLSWIGAPPEFILCVSLSCFRTLERSHPTQETHSPYFSF